VRERADGLAGPAYACCRLRNGHRRQEVASAAPAGALSTYERPGSVRERRIGTHRAVVRMSGQPAA